MWDWSKIQQFQKQELNNLNTNRTPSRTIIIIKIIPTQAHPQPNHLPVCHKIWLNNHSPIAVLEQVGIGDADSQANKWTVFITMSKCNMNINMSFKFLVFYFGHWFVFLISSIGIGFKKHFNFKYIWGLLITIFGICSIIYNWLLTQQFYSKWAWADLCQAQVKIGWALVAVARK